VLYGVYAQHFIESFTRAGEPVPEPEMQGMVRVARALPEAPQPRLELAGELLREGKADLARRVIAPVLYDADETPDRIRAQSLFAMKDTAAHP
jgi:hypothetical protein